MPELGERLAGLPPARRRLLERLIRPAATGGDVQPAPPKVDAVSEVKRGYQTFYDGINTQLDATVFGEFSFFLNYGYVPNLAPSAAAVELPDHFINKNSVRLVLEVIGDCSLTGRRILDVGCGRGGTVFVIDRFFDASEITGLDISPAAIAFCRRAHRYARTRFEQGDAEGLPFGDGRFDVVTNIESSHTYPDVRAFYSEVARVLAPNGDFLYADILAADTLQANVGFLEGLGLAVERQRDITSNVLLSCDDVSQNRVDAFDAGSDHLMRNFLATPDSDVYVQMRQGTWRYVILRMRKA